MNASGDATDLAARLSCLAPVFSVSPEQVSFFATPKEHLSYLTEGIRTARRRVALAALYIGADGDAEEGLFIESIRQRFCSDTENRNNNPHPCLESEKPDQKQNEDTSTIAEVSTNDPLQNVIKFSDERVSNLLNNDITTLKSKIKSSELSSIESNSHTNNFSTNCSNSSFNIIEQQFHTSSVSNSNESAKISLIKADLIVEKNNKVNMTSSQISDELPGVNFGKPHENATEPLREDNPKLGSKDDQMSLNNAEKLKNLKIQGDNDEESFNSIKFHILVDYLRGTRGIPSTACLLEPLVNHGLRASFYLAPMMQDGILSWRRLLPQRFNEIFGLSHLKVSVLDDNIIVTGANLSKAYFTDRHDRYICIKNHPLLANYFCDLLNTIGQLSYTLESKEMMTPSTDKLSYAMREPELPNSSAEYLLNAFINKQQNISKKSFSGSNSDTNATFIIPSLQMAPLNIRQDQAVMAKLIEWLQENLPCTPISLASGYFNLAPALQQLFSQSSAPWSLVTAGPRANGFFGARGLAGLIPDVYRLIIRSFLSNKATRFPLVREQSDCQNETDIVDQSCTPTPTDQEIIEKFIIGHDGPESEEVIFEYERDDGWTFHAKGIWVDSLVRSNFHHAPDELGVKGKPLDSPSELENQELSVVNDPITENDIRKTSRFCATVIGSSNFGTRSLERDLEAQLLVITVNEELANRIHDDRMNVFRFARPKRLSQLQTSSTMGIRARVFTLFARSFF